MLVDLINGFTDPRCPLGCESDAVVAVNARLLSAFRQRGLPVFFTTVVYHSAQQARVFRQRLPALNVLEPGSEWVAIDKRLAPVDGAQVVQDHPLTALSWHRPVGSPGGRRR